jgi:hypothetical protein
MMIKLLWRAWTMTLRGEQPSRPYGKLLDWIAITETLSQAALQQADAHGMDATVRKGITAKIDGRVQSLETVLTTVLYHAQTEFRYLLKDPAEHTLTAIYATNLNDSYAVAKFVNDAAIPSLPMREALQALATHLAEIPSSNNLSDS